MSGAFLCNMTNEEVLKKNGGRRYDICLMNPPYSNKQQHLDAEFVEKVNDICDKQIVIHPAKRWNSDTKIAKKNAEGGHLKEIEIVNGNEAFGIATQWVWTGIYVYDNTATYDNVEVKFKQNEVNFDPKDFAARDSFMKTLDIDEEVLKIAKKRDDLYDELMKNGSMVNDTKDWVYEENDLTRGRKRFGVHKDDEIGICYTRLENVKEWIKDGTYKYCIDHGSFNSPVYYIIDKDNLKEMKGTHICWLMNDKNVFDNMLYWFKSPIFNLWRFYKLQLLHKRLPWSSGCAYGYLPQIDFNKPQDEFKKYVDNLGGLTEKEIKTIKDNKLV